MMGCTAVPTPPTLPTHRLCDIACGAIGKLGEISARAGTFWIGSAMESKFRGSRGRRHVFTTAFLWRMLHRLNGHL